MFPAPWSPPSTPSFPLVTTPNVALPLGRTIIWPTYAGPAPRGRTAAALPLRWPARNAADDADYALDVSDYLADEGDTLQSVEAVAINPGTLTPVSATFDMAVGWSTIVADQIVVWLTGGQPGTDYQVQISATTARGRSMSWSVSILTMPLTTEPATWFDALLPGFLTGATPPAPPTTVAAGSVEPALPGLAPNALTGLLILAGTTDPDPTVLLTVAGVALLFPDGTEILLPPGLQELITETGQLLLPNGLPLLLA